MTVYEALMFAVTFASLVLMISSKDLEKRKRPVSSERYKENQRNGVLCHAAGLTYVPKSWVLESGQKK